MRKSITVDQPLVLQYHGNETTTALDKRGIYSGSQQNAIDSFAQEITNNRSRKLQLTFEEPLISKDKSIADKTTSLIEKFFNQDTVQNIENSTHTISSIKLAGYDFANTTLVELKPRRRRSLVESLGVTSRKSESKNPAERKTAIEGLIDFIAQFPAIETLELSDCNVGKEGLKTILSSQVRPKNIRISSILTNANGVNQDLTADVLREIGSNLEGVSIQISPVQKQSFHYHGEGTVSNSNHARGDQQAALAQLNDLLQLKSTRLGTLTFKKPNLHDSLEGYNKTITDKTTALARKLLSGKSSQFENLRDSRVAENLEHLKLSDYDFQTTAQSKIANRLPAEGENLRFLIDFLKKAKNLKSLDLSGNNLAIKEINCLLSNLVKLKKDGLQIEEIILDGNCISCEGETLLSDGKAVNNTSNSYQNFYRYKEYLEGAGVNLSLSQTRKMSSAEISTASSFDVKEGKAENFQDEITETLTIDGNNCLFNTPEGIEQFFKENKDANKALENLEISNLHFTQNDLFAFTKFLANAETLQNLVMINNNFEWQDIREILGSITSEKNVTIDISEETDRYDEKITIDRLLKFTQPNFQSTRIRMGDVDLSWPEREDAKEAAQTNLQQLSKQALELEEEVDEIIPEPQKKSLNDLEALEAIQKLIEQSGGEHKETLLSVFESLVEKSKSFDRAANLIQKNSRLFDEKSPIKASSPKATQMYKKTMETTETIEI
jgi:hypothetical protein